MTRLKILRKAGPRYEILSSSWAPNLPQIDEACRNTHSMLPEDWQNWQTNNFWGELDIVWWSLWRWWIVRWESQTETCKDETGPQISPHFANFAQTDSPTPRRQETRPKQLSTLMFAAKCKCCKDNDQNDRQSKKASKQPFAGLCLCVTVKAATPNCNSNLQLAHVLVKTEDACDLTCDHARWCDDDDRLWLCVQLHHGCNLILQPCDSTLQITCAGTAHKLLL